MTETSGLWKVVIALEATPDEVEALTDRFVDVLCPDPGHEGPCGTPWALHAVEGAALSAREQTMLREQIRDTMEG
ncbi:hypothetical protein [Streptomyces sp. YU58]|uniref:hypothetical protein n=1 Tax=Streptomyces sp. SX92 TaxID=3158972 RepID=UPI0027B8D4D4|nr:hypothetical protein [Streptomyces coralus]WLW52277.1 hypothetical protein QU709_13180 [Streptomyces coralus]